MKRLYGIRGAITCENTKDSISEKTLEMCSQLFSKNGLKPEDFVSMHFTLTKDLDEMNPCAAFRRGYKEYDVSSIPLFCSQEAKIDGGMKFVVRALLTTYVDSADGKIPERNNVYLNGAEKLRPDLGLKINSNPKNG